MSSWERSTSRRSEWFARCGGGTSTSKGCDFTYMRTSIQVQAVLRSASLASSFLRPVLVSRRTLEGGRRTDRRASNTIFAFLSFKLLSLPSTLVSHAGAFPFPFDSTWIPSTSLTRACSPSLEMRDVGFPTGTVDVVATALTVTALLSSNGSVNNPAGGYPASSAPYRSERVEDGTDLGQPSISETPLDSPFHAARSLEFVSHGREWDMGEHGVDSIDRGLRDRSPTSRFR